MKFRISDIPEGSSEREFALNDTTLPLDDFNHHDGLLKVTLVKLNGIIRAMYHLRTKLNLICDRSLDPFDYEIECNYEVLFKSGAEASEDERCAIRPLNVSGNIIDIHNEVRESIILSVPIKKIHPRYFDEEGNLTEFVGEFYSDNDVAEDSEDDVVDSRWEALKALKKNQNN
jgi:uncharacterized metal-binding protein YceD (DUF177 family)